MTPGFGTSAFRQLGNHLAAEMDLTAELAAAAAARFVDTLGVAIQGARCDVSGIVASHCRAITTSGACTILRGGSGPPALAALCNGVAAHAQDFDDATTIVLSGHLSAVLVPAVLAVGEAEGASGADVLTAFAVGCDVEMAIASVVNPHHYELGFHPTATLGVFGAAAATARLLGCDAASAARALAIGASMCSGLRANFGTMTKPLHAGWAAHNGVTAGYLAVRGMTANPDAFEAGLGFGEVYGGPGWQDRDPVAQLAKGPALLRPNVAVPKLWPCCRSIHSTVEAVLTLRSAHGIWPADAESVRIELHPRRLDYVHRPVPRDGTDAKFSTEYCAAVALRDGSVTEEHFAQPALDDPEFAALLARCTVVAGDGETARGDLMDGRDFGSTVTIVLRDGRRLVRRIAIPKGDAGNPISAGDLAAKFTACVSPVLGAAGAASLLTKLENLARMKSIRELSAAMKSTVPQDDLPHRSG
jgi:2-methylcitrate dehydratase PrpD